MKASIGQPCNQFGHAVYCERCGARAKYRRGLDVPRGHEGLPPAWYLMLPSGPAQPAAASLCEVLCATHIREPRLRTQTS